MATRRTAILLGPAVALVAVGLAGRASGAHPTSGLRSAPRSSATGPAAPATAPAEARPAGVAPLAPPVSPPVSPTVAGPVDAPVAEAARPRAAALRAAPAPEPEPAPVAGSSRQTWALIVGINTYPRGDHDLRTAAADARDVDDAVAGYGVASDHRRVLLDRSATAANIRAAFGWLTARAGPDDTAVVFFAGHAAHVGGGRRAGRPEVAAIAADDVALPQSELGRLLAPLRARSVWLAMAACYGAEFDGLLAPGRLLTAAAGRGQLAYESDALPHSYLVEYMVQQAMIDGDASRSVEEAFQWARAQIAQQYPGREPTMIDDRSAPLVLGLAPGRPPRPGRPAPPAAQREPGTPPPAPTEPAAPPGDAGCTHLSAIRLCSH